MRTELGPESPQSVGELQIRIGLIMNTNVVEYVAKLNPSYSVK